jgi:hypothetical protein
MRCLALLALFAALGSPQSILAQSSGSLIFAPEASSGSNAAASPVQQTSATMAAQIGELPPEAIIPGDSTQLPTAAPPSHGGCSCASCRSGTSHGPPPEIAGSSGWFTNDCPKAVISGGWCERPLYFDGFVGAIYGDEFVDGQINQHTSFLAGVRLGWDLDESWGWEGRLAVSDLDISNVNGPSDNRQADLLLADVSLVHYFFTDLTTRPFLSVGVGGVDVEYVDAAGLETEEQVFGVPIGIGIKHRYDDWLVFRFDLTDNMAFGGGTPMGTQHNLSATGSFELRFGGSRVSYWPWQPRRYYTW